MEHQTVDEQTTKGRSFVRYVLGRLDQDPAFGAALRRADNPATEYQSWEYLAPWCDLERESERRPFVVIAGAIARAKPVSDGKFGLGKSIAHCFEDGNQSDNAKTKLRRLLACDTVQESCAILRPLLSLMASRGVSVNYGEILDDLLWFKADRTRAHWASGFYGRKEVS